MVKNKPSRIPENKIVMAKLTREEFSGFQHYCDATKETTNAALRRIIINEVDNPVSPRVAGRNIFAYDPKKDNFAWKIALDDNTTHEIADNLNIEAMTQLSNALKNALEDRNVHLKKLSAESVAIPTRLLRKKR